MDTLPVVKSPCLEKRANDKHEGVHEQFAKNDDVQNLQMGQFQRFDHGLPNILFKMTWAKDGLIVIIIPDDSGGNIVIIVDNIISNSLIVVFCQYHFSHDWSK